MRERLSNKLHFVFRDAVARKVWVAVCLVLAIYGQSIIREPQPFTRLESLTELLARWNGRFYLLLKNPVNIALGLTAIIFSLLLYGRLIPASSLDEAVPNHVQWQSLKKFLPWGIASLGLYALVMLQLGRHQYSRTLLWLWLTSLLLFTLLFWLGEKRELHLQISFPVTDLAWMLALFAFAIAVGSYLLADIPAGWIIDEGPFWLMARGYALHEQKMPFFDLGVFSFPASSSMLQGWIMRWAGVNLWGWRFASVLPATLTVIPLYLLALELFDRRVAIAASVMMIVNPYFLTFSRLGYNNSQVLLPVTLCIYFFVLGIRRNSRLYLWLAGLTAGLGFHTYFAAWLGLIVVVLAVVGFSWLRGVKFKGGLIPLAVILAGAFVVLLPRFLYGMNGDNATYLRLKFWESVPVNTFYAKSIVGADRVAQTIQTENLLPDNNFELFYDLPLYGVLLVRGLILSAAVFFDPIINFDHNIIYGLSGPVSSIFFVLGLGATFANFRNLRGLIPATWFLAGFFVMGVLSTFPPRPTHMIAILPVLSLISAIGLVSFLDVLFGEMQRKFPWKKFVSVVILLAVAISSFVHFFFLAPYIYYPPSSDDYISWMYRQIPQPATVFLVDYKSAERNPLDEGIIKLAQHKIVTVARSGLEANPQQMWTWENFVAFVEVGNRKELADWIAQNIPGSHVQTAIATGERLRGYVVTDMRVNTEMDISPSHGLKDLWASPARNILIACGFGIAAILLGQKMAAGRISNKIGKP
jgi:4-amino-4-deoxy-L-arabinose transferase-like glycosyltransferase